MNEFTNNQDLNQTNGNNTPETGTTPNPNMQNDPYAYQNGYYRNANPHQDAAVGSSQQTTQSQQTQSSSSGNGYSYVNYYSTPDGSIPGSSLNANKPKKKHTGMKIAACILAMVVVSGASIGIYEGVRTNLLPRDAVVSEAKDKNAEKTNPNENTTPKKQSSDSSEAESWIQLASKEGAMSVADIVKKVTPSVVGVQAQFTVDNSANGGYYGNFFGFGNPQGNSGTQQVTGVGTGIVMSEEGYIVTNAHVVYDDSYGKANAVQVQMYDQETTYDARIVAFDQEADIAVLQVDAKDLVPAEFGDSSTCEVGEMVVAIGNPLGLEFQNTVTCGIISALNRQVTINDNTMTLIQTDTAINSGNSGGPLINSAGQVIGINSAKMSSSYSSNSATIEGIGFAIPMTEAKSIIDDLIEHGYVTGRPQLGISCQDVSEAVSQAYNIPVGAYIISVTENGAADQAGLRPADVITGIQGETIATTDELNNIKNQYNAGDTVTLTVVRNGETMDVDVVLEEVTRSETN